MAAPLKEMIDRAAVARLADRLAGADAGFARAAFVRAATRGLADLELKARVAHVDRALDGRLDPDFERAAAHIRAALGPPLAGSAGVSALAEYWPLGGYVARHGRDHFAAAMATLHALTQRFSAEFAIRPFIVADPARTLAVLAGWTADPSVHVRRLCSEGSRPRLPWAGQLLAIRADPGLTRRLLDALVDDPEPYVRRSVANHLNDVSKDHPATALATAAGWASFPSAERCWVIRHGLRTLVARGDPGALELLGHPPALVAVERLVVTPRRLSLGADATIELVIASRSAAPQRLLIDRILRYVRADGTLGRRVFRGGSLTLMPGERLAHVQRHRFRPITTRRHHPGRHRLEVRINGAVVGGGDVDLIAGG